LNVRYVVKPASATDPAPIYRDEHWKVYENPNFYPRGWIVHEVVVEESREALLRRLTDRAVDLRRVALLETPLPQALREAAGSDDLVRFQSYEADRMTIDVTAESNGLLVLSEMHYPGWRASVNGERAEIHKVNGGLRGVLVPAGRSQVVLEYAPASVYAGGAATLLTLLGVLAAWVLHRRRRDGIRDPLL